MPYSYTEKKRIRKNFGTFAQVMDLPNLIETQTNSYAEFLQADVAPEARKKQGLEEVFQSLFPIKSVSGNAALEYVSYELGKNTYDVQECLIQGLTYSAPLRIKVKLVLFDRDSNFEEVKDIKEGEVFMGEVPLMTDDASFIINGTERVIVSQLYRSPGVFFNRKKLKNTAGIREVLSARIIPNRGSWIDFEFDAKDLLYVQIDRRRKLPATILLRALGYGIEDLLSYFYDIERVYCQKVGKSLKWFKETPVELLKIQRATGAIYDGKKKALDLKVGNTLKKKDIKKIIDSYNKIDSQEKLILTTEKDATRLVLFENHFKGIDIIYLPIEFRFQGKTNFNELILKYVEQNRVDSKVSKTENAIHA